MLKGRRYSRAVGGKEPDQKDNHGDVWNVWNFRNTTPNWVLF